MANDAISRRTEASSIDPPEAAAGSNVVTRRFGLLDLMIVIGALAPGLAVLASQREDFSRRLQLLNWEHLTSPLWAGTPYAIQSRNSLASLVLYSLSTVVAALVFPSVGQILFRLRRPRPGWHALVLQPGFLACALALFGISLLLAWGLLISRMSSAIAATWASLPAAAVACGWTGLLIARRWRPERSWIDRAGRVLGVLWLLSSGALAAILYFVSD